MSRLILASKSPARASLLENAGLDIRVEAPVLDERAVERPLLDADLPAGDIAEILALAKAGAISEKEPGAVVIGADQILTLDDELVHKPADMEAARRRLLQLSGKSHQLNSAVALMRGGERLFAHVETADITFRKLSPEFIGRHLAAVGEQALTSVGAYQLEGRGVQLVEQIKGDYFAILGLPLLPLLAELRRMDVIEG